jgi:hypothetical protein
MQYLKIENVGVCPTEGFTIFGASSKNETTDPNIIGTFGSGAKHGISLALRQGLMPIVYCGKTRLAFYTKPLKIKGVAGEAVHQQLCVKISGHTEDNKTINQDRELDHTLSYGNKDWSELSLALREFVSNAIDACYEQGLSQDCMSVELVEENQVRAKGGTTRIFVPATMDVVRFHQEIGKWFLHFSEPQNMETKLLFKKDRNCVDSSGNKKSTAVIYRRGVRVREFTSSNVPSLFDYNIPDLSIDESRTIDDWKAKFECGQALAQAEDPTVPTLIFQKLAKEETCWELEQDGFALTYNIPDKLNKQQMWHNAFYAVCGKNAVLTTSALADRVKEKGYIPVILSNNHNGFMKFLKELSIRSDVDVLSANDLNGRKIFAPSIAVTQALNWVWDKLEQIDMTYNRPKPEVRCFKQMTESSSMTFGYWLDGTVYINEDVSQNTNNSLMDTMVEEVAHHITKATDGSRDFANFLIRMSVELAKASDPK